MNRFDYVTYDNQAQTTQAKLKEQFVALAGDIETTLPTGRAQSIVLTKLEEAYMWVGKAVRDAQITRGGGTAELNEARNRS